MPLGKLGVSVKGGGGGGKAAGLIRKLKLAEVCRSWESDTEIKTVKFPEFVGLPVIAPVVLLMLKPPGSPLAVQ